MAENKSDITNPTLPENDAPIAPPQRPLLGRQPLDDEQTMLINIFTEKGNELGQFIETLILANQVEVGQVQPYDGRWLALGKTAIQQGLMDVVRAIAKPTHF